MRKENGVRNMSLRVGVALTWRTSERTPPRDPEGDLAEQRDMLAGPVRHPVMVEGPACGLTPGGEALRIEDRHSRYRQDSRRPCRRHRRKSDRPRKADRRNACRASPWQMRGKTDGRKHENRLIAPALFVELRGLEPLTSRVRF